MLKVKVGSNSIEKAIKMFKKKFKDSGVINELRERQQFTKKNQPKKYNKLKKQYIIK